MAVLTMAQALNLALDEALAGDERVLLLGQDIGAYGGVFRITAGLWAKFGDRRVLDTPLAESGMVGAAVGMALAGLRPVVEIQFSAFALLALAHLEGQAARFRSRTHGRLSVPLVVRMPYGGGVRAPEHHSESQEAIFAHIPGLTLVAPSTPRNARALLAAAIRAPDPVLFLEPVKAYRSVREEVPPEPERLPLGKAEIAAPGSDLTALCWGAMRQPVLQAAAAVKKSHNLEVEVIDLLTISPLDLETILQSVAKARRCLVVQEAARSFSVSSELAARIQEQAPGILERPLRRVAGYDVVPPCAGREPLYYPGPGRIRRAMEELLEVGAGTTATSVAVRTQVLMGTVHSSRLPGSRKTQTGRAGALPGLGEAL